MAAVNEPALIDPHPLGGGRLHATPFAPLAPSRGPSLRQWMNAGQWLVTLALVAFLTVPVVMSMLAGLTVNYFRGLSSGLTLQWVIQVWAMYHDSIYASLLVALGTLVITLVTGVPAAYALARSPSRLSRWIEELLVLPVALPGLASALALIAVYGGFGAFRQSFAFIIVGHVIFTLPFMVRAVAAICASVDLRTLEEGAASLGAGFTRRFFTIVLPNIRPGIVAGAVAVVTLSLGEFNLTWMLHTPDTKTLPVGLADAYASMRIEIGSAYTLIFLLMALPLLLAMQWFSADATRARAQRRARIRQAAAQKAPGATQGSARFVRAVAPTTPDSAAAPGAPLSDKQHTEHLTRPHHEA
jgi:putative spermidine/putrescine transport system permease protein